MIGGDKFMRILQKSDQDVYDTISMANKMNYGEKVFYSICHYKGLDKKSSDYWFYRVLLNGERLKKNESEILDLLEYCDNALEIEEGHWPACYLRSLFILLMQESLEEDSTIQYTIPGYKDSDEHLIELDDLLNLQKEGLVPELFMTYCLVALVYLYQNKVEIAVDYLQKGLEETTAGKVKYLTHFFKTTAHKIYNHKKLKDNIILKQAQSRFRVMSLME